MRYHDMKYKLLKDINVFQWIHSSEGYISRIYQYYRYVWDSMHTNQKTYSIQRIQRGNYPVKNFPRTHIKLTGYYCGRILSRYQDISPLYNSYPVEKELY